MTDLEALSRRSLLGGAGLLLGGLALGRPDGRGDRRHPPGLAARARSTSWSSAPASPDWSPPGRSRPRTVGAAGGGPRPGRRPGAQPPARKDGVQIESGGAFVGPTQDHILRLAKRARGADVPGVQHRQQRLHLLDHRPDGVHGHRPARPHDPSRRRSCCTRIDSYAAEIAVDAPGPTRGRRVGRDDARRVHPHQRAQPHGVENLINCWTQPGFGADPERSRSSSPSGTSPARATRRTSAPSPATPTPPTAPRSAGSSAAPS